MTYIEKPMISTKQRDYSLPPEEKEALGIRLGINVPTSTLEVGCPTPPPLVSVPPVYKEIDNLRHEIENLEVTLENFHEKFSILINPSYERTEEVDGRNLDVRPNKSSLANILSDFTFKIYKINRDMLQLRDSLDI